MAIPGTPSGENHSADNEKCGWNVRPRASSSACSSAMRASSGLPSMVTPGFGNLHIQQLLIRPARPLVGRNHPIGLGRPSSGWAEGDRVGGHGRGASVPGDEKAKSRLVRAVFTVFSAL